MWGIDCKKRAISLARKSLAALEASNEAYERCAAPCTLRHHNIFLPTEFLTVRLLDSLLSSTRCGPCSLAQSLEQCSRSLPVWSGSCTQSWQLALSGPLSVCQLHQPTSAACTVQGKFDRVHVGAACPPKRLAALKKLLKPSGGVIVTPVTTSDLQRISVSDGCVRVETLSRVRYSNLEVGSPSLT